MSDRRKPAILAAMFVIAAIAFGGGYWLHQQRQERAWSVLLDMLRRNRDEVAYSDASYSLFSQTLSVRDLRVQAGKGTQGRTTSVSGSDVAGDGFPLIQAGTLRLKGADYSGERNDPATLTRFEELEALDLVVTFPFGTIKADRLSAGPASERTAALNALKVPRSEQTIAEAEEALGSVLIQKIRLAGLKATYADSSGKIRPFSLSVAELDLGRLSPRDSGPMTARDIQWTPGPLPTPDTHFQPAALTGITAKTFSLKNLRLPPLLRFMTMTDTVSDAAGYEAGREFLMQEFGLSELRVQELFLQVSILGLHVAEATLSTGQKNGATYFDASVEGVDSGRMTNFLLLKALPELSAIPDAANLPLSFSGNASFSLRWFAPDNGFSFSTRASLRDIADARLDTDFASMSWEDMVEKLRQVEGGSLDARGAGYEIGQDWLRGVHSLTFTLTDHKFLEYLQKVTAAKSGVSFEEIRARIVACVNDPACQAEKKGNWVNLPALGDFLEHSGTLQLHFLAKNGMVPMQQFAASNNISHFTITAKHLPRPSGTP